MRKIISVSAILLVLFIIVLGGHHFFVQASNGRQTEGEIVDEDSHFKIIYDGDSKYHYIIYNKENEVVKEDNQYGTIPSISYIDEKTIQILLPAGTDIFTCVYYDTFDDKFSQEYTSPIIVQYGKIAYIDHSKMPYVFVVRDIYDKNIFSKNFSLDLSPSVSPIIEAEFLDEETLFIVYTFGEFFEEASIELNLN